MLDPTATEWVHLVLRWMHVIAAIAWIGHAFLFNELEHALTPPADDDEPGRVGDVWMVHGGGFFRLIKTRAWPTAMRGKLHWFMFEALFTWLSGFFLLIVVYYLGGMLVDRAVADLPMWAAASIGLGSLVVGWVVYDLLCRSPLGKHDGAFAAVGFVLMAGAAWGLSHLLSGRAAFIHVGAMIGTMMVANVWMVVIPTMRKMVAQVQGTGGILDADLGWRAKQRSLHNNYFVYPLIFIMISSHFPSTYAHGWNWAVLAGIALLGAIVKHIMNLRGEIQGVYLAGGAIVAGFVLFTGLSFLTPASSTAAVADTGAKTPIDAATVGVIRGTVRLEGEDPEPEVLLLGGGCERGHTGPVLNDGLRVRDGRVRWAFVHLSRGWERWELPPVPTTEVVVDQSGCIYLPHVVGVRTGQPVTFLNSDPLFHNVRSIVATNTDQAFNELMPEQGQRFTRVFRQPEVMVQARCDVHPWMAGYLGIVPHPWFATTDAAGGFSLQDVPPGKYTVSVWHERLGTVSREVEVPASGWVELDLVLPGAAP